MPSTHLNQAYESAFDHVLTVRHPTPGVIRMEGTDRLDFLHRMSTNEVRDLAPGMVRRTVLTSDIACMQSSRPKLTRAN